MIMGEKVGLADYPHPPPEPKHSPDATYILCGECGREIWDDTDETWLEGSFGALCTECIDNCRKWG
jgi:hypothetical protein